MPAIAKNKTGLFNYEPLEKFQAGLVLTGAEVKAIRLGHINLKGSYIQIDGHNEVWLINCYIAPYKPAAGHQVAYDPYGRRKLLLNKKEIASLIGQSKQKGLTIIPTSVYTNKGLIKIDLAVARGKKTIDKRATIKKREQNREISRTLKKI
ncbi:MAG: SsrA-binding protein SmpB [Patescibacteria group bacterium]